MHINLIDLIIACCICFRFFIAKERVERAQRRNAASYGSKNYT